MDPLSGSTGPFGGIVCQPAGEGVSGSERGGSTASA